MRVLALAERGSTSLPCRNSLHPQMRRFVFWFSIVLILCGWLFGVVRLASEEEWAKRSGRVRHVSMVIVG